MLRYKMRSATVALIHENARDITITVPSGTILNVPDGLANAAGLVEVEWDGETVRVFAVDLRDRGELSKAMSATGGAK